jgi:hypothetical protein
MEINFERRATRDNVRTELLTCKHHKWQKTGWEITWKSTRYTDKKEDQIFLIYKEIQSGAVAKSYMRKGFLIYEEMRKYFPLYEVAVSHI